MATESQLKVVDGKKKDMAIPQVGSTAWASEIRTRAKELAKDLDTGYMELAKHLYNLFDVPKENDPKNKPWIAEWGYKTIGQFAEKELGLHRRKAERLRLIWYRLEIELTGMPQKTKDRIVKLGWSKVRELMRPRVMTLKNAEEWIKRSEECSYPELCETIRVYLAKLDEEEKKAEASGKDPTEVAPTVPEKEDYKFEHFMLYDGQSQTVEAALDRASQLSNSDKKGHNLEMICTDFLATNDFKAGGPEERLRYIAKVEKTLGVRLVAIDPATNQVIYGMAALEKLAEGS